MTTTKHLAVGTTALGAAGCAACCVAPVAAVAATTIFAPLAAAGAVTAVAITLAQRRSTNEPSQNRSLSVEATTTATRPLRTVLAAILVASAALFALGAAREHAIHHHETARPAVTATNNGESGSHTESGTESRPQSSTEQLAQHTSETTTEGRVLGVDLEASPLVAAAVIASIALAILVLRIPRRSILLTIGIFVAVATVFDIAEVAHQIHDSQQLLTFLAVLVAALHAAGVALAVMLATGHFPTSKVGALGV
jgi:Flp pilus assembly protein TadB